VAGAASICVASPKGFWAWKEFNERKIADIFSKD
jgi:hypothetical protein